MDIKEKLEKLGIIIEENPLVPESSFIMDTGDKRYLAMECEEDNTLKMLDLTPPTISEMSNFLLGYTPSPKERMDNLRSLFQIRNIQ